MIKRILSNIKYLLTFGLLCCAGCTLPAAQMYSGEARAHEQATIRSDRKGQSMFARHLEIIEIDNKHTVGLFKCILTQKLGVEAAYILPGKHSLTVHPVIQGFQDDYIPLWFVAKPGGDYLIRFELTGYRLHVWIEDQKTGQPVGGICGSMDEPLPMVYHPATPERDEQARQQLQIMLQAGTDFNQLDKYLPERAICGPFLWVKLYPYAALRNFAFAPARFMLSIYNHTTGIPERQELRGVLMQDRQEVRDFWSAFINELGPLSDAVIRKLTDAEKQMLWLLIPFEAIEEPVFVIEDTDCKVVVMMMEEEKTPDGVGLLWFSDLDWIAAADEQALTLALPESLTNQ